MQRKRFMGKQIIRILHNAEVLGNVRDVCSQHNIAEQTLYRRRRQFGGMEVAEVKRLRALERENAPAAPVRGAYDHPGPRQASQPRLALRFRP